MEHAEYFREEDNFAAGFQGLADRKATLAYAADPELHAFAESQSARYVTAMCIEYGADEATEPAVPILRAAFTRLNFAFTDRHDYTDTIDGTLLANEVVSQEISLVQNRGRKPALQEIAIHFGLWAAVSFVVKMQLDDRNELEGLSPDECFAVVKGRLQLMNMRETGEPAPDA